MKDDLKQGLKMPYFPQGLAVLLGLLLILLPMMMLPSPVKAMTGDPAETKEQHNARMAWWREARFGLFIHWGLYSVPAGIYNGHSAKHGLGEWIMNAEKIPLATYAGYANQFNPTEFNAEEWVKLAKYAGMKYVIYVAKHHDGFAMFKTSVDNYNIVDGTEWGRTTHRDPCKELAEACAKEGLKFGVYYSQIQDWHHPGGWAFGNGKEQNYWDPAQEGKVEDYIKNVAVPQIKELLTNYGPISVIWFDTPGKTSKELADMIYEPLKLQPDIIANNRLGGGYKGDTETPEQHIPATGYPDRDWETCMTMNTTWGYRSDFDDKYKSSQVLIRMLTDTASKGGNFLLNIGPKPDGSIPVQQVERLKAMGDWMKVNSSAIYGTSAGPFANGLDWGCATQKDGKLFLIVYNWPKDGKLLVPMSSAVSGAHLLAAPDTPLSTTPGDKGLVVNVPAEAPDKDASVIELDVTEPIKIVRSFAVTKKGETIVFAADKAEIKGKKLALNKSKDGTWLDKWINADDYAEWPIELADPGTYKVKIEYAVAQNCEGSTFTIMSDDGQSITGTTEATGSNGNDWKTFKTFDLGNITLVKAGQVAITLKCTKKAKFGVMNVKSITFEPVAQ